MSEMGIEDSKLDFCFMILECPLVKAEKTLLLQDSIYRSGHLFHFGSSIEGAYLNHGAS